MSISASDADLSVAAAFLKTRGFTHLRCRRRGNAVILESGPKGDVIAHVRFRKIGPRAWAVDAATHTGRWEGMHLHGHLGENLKAVAEAFPWLLAGRD